MKNFPAIFCLIIFSAASIMAQGKNASVRLDGNKTQGEPIKTVLTFIDWYRTHYRDLYTYQMTYTDSTGNYRVNIKDCKKYFESLKSSGCISDEYVRLWSEYCISKNESFLISPQNEGPPEGFDMDLVLLTQEPEEIFKIYKTMKYTIVEENQDSSVILGDTGWPDWVYVFELSHIQGRWYIDYISIQEPE